MAESPAQDEEVHPSWEAPVLYKVVHKSGALVRAQLDISSAPVRELYYREEVQVVEVQGRRAHVVAPVEGWMSTETKDGVQILRPRKVQRLLTQSSFGGVDRGYSAQTVTSRSESRLLDTPSAHQPSSKSAALPLASASALAAAPVVAPVVAPAAAPAAAPASASVVAPAESLVTAPVTAPATVHATAHATVPAMAAATAPSAAAEAALAAAAAGGPAAVLAPEARALPRQEATPTQPKVITSKDIVEPPQGRDMVPPQARGRESCGVCQKLDMSDLCAGGNDDKGTKIRFA